MKKTARASVCLLLVLLLVFCFSACGKKTLSADAIWEKAVYHEDTELGEGKKTVSVEVKAGEKSVKFTVHTDQETVGAALMEQNLISGEDGEYGLYVKAVNGITADYDTDGCYWAFYIDGEYAVSGVDSTEIAESVEYQLVRSK